MKSIRMTVLCALAALLALSLSACDSAPPVVRDMALQMSANAPLTGRLTFVTDEPAIVSLTIRDDDNSATVTPSNEYAVEHDVMVLGLAYQAIP